MMLLLLACAQPPLVDAVQEQLAEQVLARGETPLRLFVALSSVAAETCGLTDEQMAGVAATETTPEKPPYTFVGGGARALGLAQPVITELTSGNHQWVFDNVGLDDVGTGELTLETPPDHGSYEVTYTLSTAGITVTGSIPVLLCDVEDSDPTDAIALQGDVATGGSLDFTEDAVGTQVVAHGDRPFEGLHFNPPTDTNPWAGWAKWDDESEDASERQSLELDGAANIDQDEWPATASGAASNGVAWQREVAVRLP